MSSGAGIILPLVQAWKVLGRIVPQDIPLDNLNEASVHACPLLGVNIGPLLYAIGLAVWFV